MVARERAASDQDGRAWPTAAVGSAAPFSRLDGQERPFLAGITQTEAAVLAARHVTEFNDAVAARNFSGFLCLFTDDAVIRFENVPGAGQLEFAGREAYTQAYAKQPPDDKIDICGLAEPDEDGDGVVVPFTRRRDASPGTIRLTYTRRDDDELDSRLVTRMTVTFG